MTLIIADHLGEGHIIPELSGDTKVAVLRELCEVACRDGDTPTHEQALAAMIEREALGSTGIGDGVAIPHAKIPDLDELRIVLGLSHKGVEFDASDGAPVHLLFLIAAPVTSKSRDHLQVLARLARMVRAPGFRSEVMGLDSQTAIQHLVARIEREMFEDTTA